MSEHTESLRVWTIRVCPECGWQELDEDHPLPDGTPTTEYCLSCGARFKAAEEVEVIPADSPRVLSVDAAKTILRFSDLVESEAGSAHISNADYDFLIRIEKWAAGQESPHGS
jgi:hypothetical protein